MNTDTDYQHPFARFLECCDLSQLFRWGDLSPKQRRVQRRDEKSVTYASQVGGRKRDREPQVVDGDKSPAESGDKSPHSKT